MSVLFTNVAQVDISGPNALEEPTLVQIVTLLEKLDPNNPEATSKVRRIHDAEEEIYVLREKGLRVFFTRRGDDIVVLSITNG